MSGSEKIMEKAADSGVENGIAQLTDSEIKKVVNNVLKNETGARFKAYVETCIHCGLCSDACHFYISHDKDPSYSPVGKVKRTIWEMIRRKGEVNGSFIKEAAIVAHTECNLCKRCVHFCPFGIDIAYMMAIVRRIIHKLGCTPQYIQDTAHSHSVHMNQMWVKGDEWPDTLQWQEEEAQGEIPGLRIPLDKEGAEVMYSVIAPEPKFRPQLIYEAAVIFNAAKIDWTMPSSIGWDNSDMAMFTGDNEIMGRIKKTHFETALGLKVKKIVMGECGHAFRSVVDMGNRWLGFAHPPLPIIHAIEFYHDIIREGRIKIRKKFDKPVTLHDPCNVVRGGGLHKKARWLANALCEEVIEMDPGGMHNYCCGAGGGVINCGPPYKLKRIQGNRVKAEQIFRAKTRGATTLIAPCHNCHSGLHDIIEHYQIGVDIKFFGNLIYELMEKPET